jgi:NDP-sugar pyrophosphorylase family protein
MSKRAVILAGGKGTRLKPYTVVLPKPLMPIGEYPILEVVIRQLIQHEFNHITLAVNHQADLIKAFFGNGEKWNIKIDYSVENIPLSTMGPLKIISDLPDDFLVMNGDILTDLNYSRFFDEHVEGGNIFTISSYQREQMSDYGVLELNASDILTGFKEKPTVSYNVSMGIYAVSKRVLKTIPDNVPFGFDHLMLALLKKKENVCVACHKGYWLDIGRPDDYEKAIEEFERSKNIFLNE